MVKRWKLNIIIKMIQKKKQEYNNNNNNKQQKMIYIYINKRIKL